VLPLGHATTGETGKEEGEKDDPKNKHRPFLKGAEVFGPSRALSLRALRHGRSRGARCLCGDRRKHLRPLASLKALAQANYAA
jgi:hypothetical protein